MNRRTSDFEHYWRTLWSAIVTTIGGLGVTLKYLFSRPVTIEYPDMLPVIPDGWRGYHAFESDKCIRCRLCAQACPVDCIAVELEGKGKTAKILKYEIDYTKCLFCNLCCEACPTECLWMTDDWDLACYRREDCICRLEGRNPDEERKKKWPSMKTHPARLAEAARAKAEKKAREAAAETASSGEAPKRNESVSKPSEEKSE